MHKISIFYKTSIFLAITICILSITQSYKLRTQLNLQLEETTLLQQKNEKQSKIEQIAAFEHGYKQSSLDSFSKKNKYLITSNSQITEIWKLDEVIKNTNPTNPTNPTNIMDSQKQGSPSSASKAKDNVKDIFKNTTNNITQKNK